jgi:ribosomal protein S18 acetylase RimI-like enzyme
MSSSVRRFADADRDWARTLLRERWGSETMAVHGVVYEPAELDGFVAEGPDGERLGLLTYHVESDACEIVSLDALEPRRGVGTALLEAVRELGYRRLWAVTTNDNVDALAFYEARGFHVATIREGAVDRARATLKPEIPLVGQGGIPIRDEIELERL